ncbi:MAG: CBS domain-containing protein, partial [Myxococcales bacterium]|nr:CBS domain-containing protein [Myxococcales bacterium]
MTADPFVLRADDELDLAGDVMKLNRIRHMPVLSESDDLVGILSQRD